MLEGGQKGNTNIHSFLQAAAQDHKRRDSRHRWRIRRVPHRSREDSPAEPDHRPEGREDVHKHVSS